MEGLTTQQARDLQSIYGRNELTPQKKQGFLTKALHVASEPMFLLLIAAAVIYFILGEAGDGAVMLVFVAFIIGIDIFQEWKTDKTLEALKELSAPRVTVIRDGRETEIAGADIVPGDIMLICEGAKIPADGKIIKCSDLSADESLLTGESLPVLKEPGDMIYCGTLAVLGTAAAEVTHIGASTEYGKIGVFVAEAPDRPTPLEKQTGSLVKLCAGVAAALFALVAVFTFLNIPGRIFRERITESVLSGITLAMAMIPEEFPVILAVFLSMGAWRLAKKQTLVRRLSGVETLGAVSVLCVDKTGTITTNRMTVQSVWAAKAGEAELAEIMGLACETDAYDPMEKAILDYCKKLNISKSHLFGGTLISEYAFTNELKMMGHIWRHDGEIIIAAKGSPEHILTLCRLADGERSAVDKKILEMSESGLRVIAAATAKPADESGVPVSITDCELTFVGLVGLADPPRETVKNDIAMCGRAGVRVVMITGDSGLTAAAVAKRIGMENCDNIITGGMIEQMSDTELREKVKTANIFSRVVPEHKMRIVKAYKENGEIVAMTGDGVNDAPALKYADIGIAMGKRGSEVSREAADLILLDDNFSTIADTIKDGRRIYSNIRKAVEYVLTIHIPIALSSLFAPILGIDPDFLMLLPLHVVLLELIIDPTCSIVLERCPARRDIMEKPPRNPRERLVGAGALASSAARGITIFIGAFGMYYFLLQSPGGAPAARAAGLAVLMLSSLFLVTVDFGKIDKTVLIIAGTVSAGLVVILYTPLNIFLKLAPLSAAQLALTLAVAAVSVLWYNAANLIYRKMH